MHRAGIEVILRRDNHDIERTQPDETLTNKGGKKFTSSLEVEKIRPEAVCLENGGEIYVTFANPVNAKSIEAIIRHSSDYEMVKANNSKGCYRLFCMCCSDDCKYLFILK